jgi:hypothetical protein
MLAATVILATPAVRDFLAQLAIMDLWAMLAQQDTPEAKDIRDQQDTPAVRDFLAQLAIMDLWAMLAQQDTPEAKATLAVAVTPVVKATMAQPDTRAVKAIGDQLDQQDQQDQPVSAQQVPGDW